jgi:hypothetical protein
VVHSGFLAFHAARGFRNALYHGGNLIPAFRLRSLRIRSENSNAGLLAAR